MIVTTVMVKIKPDHIADFIKATTKNHEASIKELGNQRFDVLQSPDDPTSFMLYEAYNSPDAAAAHKHTTHYLEWKEKVADWMAEPRKGIPYHSILPL
jgi:(4S)-4-hydroxy-5-phosphonooxypentane-2,3-dione isomerase